MLFLLAGYAHPSWPDVVVRIYRIFANAGFAHMQTVYIKAVKIYIGYYHAN